MDYGMDTKLKVRRIILKLLRLSGIYNFSLFRNIFWDLRAKACYDKWGDKKGDYDVLKDIIVLNKINHILDFGCGNGRLFPLYISLNIKKIIGQDISKKSLDFAFKRNSNKNIQLTNLPISELVYPDFYFDLIISMRVLQHVPLISIEETIKNICRLSKLVYINEVSDVDINIFGLQEIEELKNPYCFKHDYIRLFGIYNFKVKSEGLIGNHKWILFERIE